MLPLLSEIAPRMEWPRLKGGTSSQASPALVGRASSFQLEHVNEVHAALVRRYPRVARSLDPTTVRTKREASAFIAKAMAVLHPGPGAET